VGRQAREKAHKRIAEKIGESADELLKITSFLNKGYDSYVHGSHDSAMELFTGQTMGFEMKGTESPRNACMAKVSVAGKVYDALNALSYMAMTREMKVLYAELRSAFDTIRESGEGGGLPCRDL